MKTEANKRLVHPLAATGKLSEHAAARNELRVRALLRDGAVVHDDDDGPFWQRRRRNQPLPRPGSTRGRFPISVVLCGARDNSFKSRLLGESRVHSPAMRLSASRIR